MDDENIFKSSRCATYTDVKINNIDGWVYREVRVRRNRVIRGKHIKGDWKLVERKLISKPKIKYKLKKIIKKIMSIRITVRIHYKRNGK